MNGGNYPIIAIRGVIPFYGNSVKGNSKEGNSKEGNSKKGSSRNGKIPQRAIQGVVNLRKIQMIVNISRLFFN